MQIALLVPGDLRTATGGYAYARRLVRGLREAGHRVDRLRLSDTFPRPDARALDHADRLLGDLPDRTITVIDGLAFGAMPGVVRAHAERLALVALVHHPLAAETGLAPDEARDLDAAERCALAYARRVVVTSASTAGMIETMGVSRTRIVVVEPGTDPAPPSRANASPRAAQAAAHRQVALLCVATLTPRKGHADLLAALARMTDLSWRLDCVGSATRDPRTAEAVRAEVAERGLSARVSLHGEVGPRRLSALYRAADAFVLPSRMEGYGMAFAEALAFGLPVVGCRAGAVPDTVPPDASLLVPAGDLDALAAALRNLVSDPALRSRLAEGAMRAGARLPDWPSRARAFAHALDDLAD
jgi:glycosyltransferase involved in cell wall biosynthesis